MHAFDYHAPNTLAEAIEQLAQANGQARPLAGGTDLIDQMRCAKRQPSVVIDIKKLPELRVLQVDAAGLRLGAAVPCCEITSNATIARDYAALADSCSIIGGVQIQSRASVGGNLCNSGPAADTTPSLIALAATCVIAGSAGTREVPVESFCTAPNENVLGPGELLVELRLPAPAPHSGSHYRRVIPRNEMDIAVVGVGAQVRLDESGESFAAARIGLGAVGPVPILAHEVAEALVGQPITEDTVRRAAETAKRIISPITDMRGTREYRIHVTGVLVERVLHAAIARAKGETIDYRPGH
ncbi:MAG: xanthine dehydrogenase family protein subunit M [Hyphomicrobiaceae bacterium]|nr:xanthine dehydrogenase family protein subunit M [Hyphomicrobiaceae bacterium]